MGRDFTLTKYASMCHVVMELGSLVLTVSDYLENKFEGAESLVILRHDVDRAPATAVAMASLEHDLGVKSTYYFRDVPGVFDVDAIRTIATMGHEVGYHYESLPQARGDYEKAIELFRRSLNKFRDIVDVKTISMHGRPFSPYDSRDIWKRYDYKSFGLLGEAYLSIDYDRVKYFCDTGRTWHGSKYNIRDKVDSSHVESEIDSTDELIGLLRSRRFNSVCISSHPNRWREGCGEWFYSAMSDYVINVSKLAIKGLLH